MIMMITIMIMIIIITIMMIILIMILLIIMLLIIPKSSLVTNMCVYIHILYIVDKLYIYIYVC